VKAKDESRIQAESKSVEDKKAIDARMEELALQQLSEATK
jgi:hypothetical protein